MKGLSSRQHDVLEYVYSHWEEQGRCPTGPEIARHFELKSLTSGYQFLASLENKGYLETRHYGPGRPASILLTNKARRLFAAIWPILGVVPSGSIAKAMQSSPDHLETIQDLLPQAERGDFFLRVQGDSMLEDGIRPGQLALLRPSREPADGDICAVWVEGYGGMLKRIHFEGAETTLIPSNPRYSSSTYPSSDVKIQGVLIAVLDVRSFVNGK